MGVPEHTGPPEERESTSSTGTSTAGASGSTPVHRRNANRLPVAGDLRASGGVLATTADQPKTEADQSAPHFKEGGLHILVLLGRVAATVPSEVPR